MLREVNRENWRFQQDMEMNAALQGINNQLWDMNYNRR
jgi:hypothetical protein